METGSKYGSVLVEIAVYRSCVYICKSIIIHRLFFPLYTPWRRLGGEEV
jgi:hypothetical protein